MLPCLVLGVIATCSISAAMTETIQLVANLADRGPQIRGTAAGILHSFNATHPPMDAVRPLRLHMYRGPERFHLYDNTTTKNQGPRLFANTARLEELGIRTQLLLSDIYFAVRDHAHLPVSLLPGDNGNFTLWKWVVAYCIEAAIHAGHEDVYWDIYNEPNIGFKNRSIEQFYAVWATAYALIKTRLPHAVVVGPSIADIEWNETFLWMQQFLLRQNETGQLPDILCWHVGYSNGSVLADQHDAVKAFLTLKRISIQRFAHNEVIGQKSSLSPGVAVSFISNLERLAVDHACRACWREFDYLTGDREDTCWDQSLDGLLAVDYEGENYAPRSVWWAYRYYADMSGWTVPIDGPIMQWQLDGLLSWNSAGNVSILLGRIGESNQSVAVDFTLNGISMSSFIVSMQFIPYTGMLPLYNPVPVHLDVVMETENDSFTMNLPKLYKDEAVWITVSRKHNY